MIDFIKGDKEWGVMTRTGLSASRDIDQGFKKLKQAFSNIIGSFKYWVVIYGVTLIVVALILQVLIDNSVIPDVYSMIKNELGI